MKKQFIRVKVETYRRPQPTNKWEDSEEIDEEDLEVCVCDCLLSIDDIQMITDINKDDRIAVMLTDSSIVSVLGTIQEFEEKMRGIN